jgi:hypothetical protein
MEMRRGAYRTVCEEKVFCGEDDNVAMLMHIAFLTYIDMIQKCFFLKIFFFELQIILLKHLDAQTVNQRKLKTRDTKVIEKSFSKEKIIIKKSFTNK